MKLDFNFPIFDFEDRPAGQASKPMINVLGNGNTNDKHYQKKIKDWKKQLKETGAIAEIDRTDAEVLSGFVLNCPVSFNFVKIALGDYIDARIEASKPNDPKDKDKDKDKSKNK